MITVRFLYMTGTRRPLFRNARLAGSWSGWTEVPMEATTGDDGCPAFAATVEFDDARAGEEVAWGVRLDGPQGANVWAVNRESTDPDPRTRQRRHFRLPGAGTSHEERYYFLDSRRFGAQKFYGRAATPDLRFSVWAPNARKVEVVFSTPDHGYIADDGEGIDPNRPAVPLVPQAGGIWESAPLPDFASFVGTPYMFRIENSQSRVVYRTDIHSRWQIGRGDRNPAIESWDGDPATLEGGVSCSVVIDQDVVRREF